jgi:hypothetical protein
MGVNVSHIELGRFGQMVIKYICVDGRSLIGTR